MAKKTVRKKTQNRHHKSSSIQFGKKSSVFWPNLGSLLALFALLVGLTVSMMALSTPTPSPKRAAACNDHACQNIKEGDAWMIINCNPTPPDANGDWQLCTWGGRVGQCGGKSYCCPSPGAQWTSDMTACPECSITGASNVKVQNITGTSATLTWTPGTGGNYVKMWVSKSSNPTGDCGRLTSKTTDASCVVNENSDNGFPASPGSYQLSNLSPNTTYYWRLMMWAKSGCDAGGETISFTTTAATSTPVTTTPANTVTSTIASTPVNTVTNTPTKSPTPTRVSTPVTYYTATPKPTIVKTATPTPTVYVLNYCNKSCSTDSECPGGLVCAGGGVLGLGKTCRNSYCKENISCLCNDTPSGGSLSVVPTIDELNPIGSGRQIVLTATTVADRNGNASDRPTFSGMTEPGATVTISVFPDGVSGTVTADTTGKWSWRPEKALTAGKKDVVIVSKKDGGQGQVTQSFNVVAGAKVNWFGILLLVMILVAVGFGAYVYYKSL